jgi:hypothetical protein
MDGGVFDFPCPVYLYGRHVFFEFYQIFICLMGPEMTEKDSRIAPNF